ncbi:hypothetical protein GW916_12325 [bacterium]|nr:hypothetical protein [bacterium]
MIHFAMDGSVVLSSKEPSDVARLESMAEIFLSGVDCGGPTGILDAQKPPQNGSPAQR